ncbi:MAG: TauD/TfdA family dioxygenase [bacterium]|nr:TauD/TfdA family dioxygenase [bacterium]
MNSSASSPVSDSTPGAFSQATIASGGVELRAPAITGIDTADDAIHVRWSDGVLGRFHLLWLRDNCSSVRHPGTGQRLVDITELPRDISIQRAQLETDDSLLIHWAGDRHISRFAGAWLRKYAGDLNSARTGQTTIRSGSAATIESESGETRIWNDAGQELADEPEFSYDEIAASPEALRDWLRQVRRHGFARLRDVPCTPGYVLKIVPLFGYVRETNYGRLMDIQCQGEPNNLVFSNAALAPHTDNPYRDPAPTLKLLHCLKNCADQDGGESVLVDGFAAAEELRRTAPDQFSLLANIQVLFRFNDDDVDLECERSVLDLDPDGAIRGVYFNHRSMAPLRLAPGVMESYYRAYLAFANKLQSARNQLRFHLQPGELYIVDNRRVLHGRTQYRNPFDRHLQACYADRDGLLSRLRILDKQLS